MKRNYSLFISDILDAIEHIENFINGIDINTFYKDEKTNSAVVRKLEIIGEASKNIPDEISKKYPQIPWADMAKMRDKIIHSYFGVDLEIVWKTITQRLPSMKKDLEYVLKELKK